MPTQETPASRKFAPPSARSSIPTAPPPPSSSRPAFVNRLVRTSQPSNSPSTRTVFSNTIEDGQSDEIDADEWDEDHLLPRQPPTRSIGRNIGLENDRLSGLHNAPGASANSQQRSIPQRDPTQSHFTSSTKRRKLSHFISETIDDYGSDSSSSSSPPSPSTRAIEQDVQVEVLHTSPEAALHNETITTTYRNDDDNDSDPTDHSPNAQDIATPKKHNRHSNPISRYKTPYPFPPPSSLSNHAPPQSTDATIHQPLPSFQSRLLASFTTSSTTGPHLRGPQPSLDFTLPDAFSPSRRRGNREYLHSGHAETVRGWILDLAARMNTSAGESSTSTSNNTSTTKSASQSHVRNSSGDNGRVRVEDVVVRDPAGRFIIIKTEAKAEVGGTEAQEQVQEQEQQQKEEGGKSAWWLLTNVDQHHQQGYGVGAGSKFDRVKPGVWIVVKGGEAASWMLDLAIQSDAGSKLRVAVLWDLVQ